MRIHIDELILDGTTQINQVQLAQAIQQALVQHVANHGLPSTVSLPHVQGDVDVFTSQSVAGQIAQTVYGGQK